MKNALILVDIQNDFMPSGALPVPHGDEIVPLVNQLMARNFFDVVVATQDWHPADHKSFASNQPDAKVGEVGQLNGVNQVWWPDHCIQGTKGADFHRDLNLNRVNAVFRKGENPEVDSYSGFYSNSKKGGRDTTGLRGYLYELLVSRIYIVGLALDYCVKFTAIDAVKYLHVKTHIILDGCRAVDPAMDQEHFDDEMDFHNVSLIKSNELK